MPHSSACTSGACPPGRAHGPTAQVPGCSVVVTGLDSSAVPLQYGGLRVPEAYTQAFHACACGTLSVGWHPCNAVAPCIQGYRPEPYTVLHLSIPPCTHARVSSQDDALLSWRTACARGMLSGHIRYSAAPAAAAVMPDWPSSSWVRPVASAWSWVSWCAGELGLWHVCQRRMQRANAGCDSSASLRLERSLLTEPRLLMGV